MASVTQDARTRIGLAKWYSQVICGISCIAGFCFASASAGSAPTQSNSNALSHCSKEFASLAKAEKNLTDETLRNLVVFEESDLREVKALMKTIADKAWTSVDASTVSQSISRMVKEVKERAMARLPALPRTLPH